MNSAHLAHSVESAGPAWAGESGFGVERTFREVRPEEVCQLQTCHQPLKYGPHGLRASAGVARLRERPYLHTTRSNEDLACLVKYER